MLKNLTDVSDTLLCIIDAIECFNCDKCVEDIFEIRNFLYNLDKVIRYHHGQKADDRCMLDDDKLYAAAGLPVVDRRVGDKCAMLENCRKFIELRCESGGWPTYKELEDKIKNLNNELKLANLTIEKYRKAIEEKSF